MGVKYIQYLDFVETNVVAREDLKKEVGKRLRFLRESRMKHDPRWTQGYVADQLNISVSLVSAYERGERLPPSDNLAMFARLYGTSTDYLLGMPEDDLTDQPNPLDDVTAAMAHRLKELSPRGRKIVERLIEEFEEEDRLERERADR